MNNSAVPDQVQGTLAPNQSKLKATDEDKLNQWGSTASAAAKLLLRGVKECADAFPPLKSVVGGLCFILDNYEVWHSFSIHFLQHSQIPLENKGKQAGNNVINTQGQGTLCFTL